MKKLLPVCLLLQGIFLLNLVSCTKKDETSKAQPQTNNQIAIQTVVQYPQRIVALSPSAGEILFAVGAENQVAAVSEFTDYPPEAASKPVVGGFDGKTLSMESILGFKPDFLYLTDGMHNFLIEQLDSYGIKYYLSKGDSIRAVMQEILDIGMLTGHAEKAVEIVQDMTKKIDGIKKAS